MANDYPQGTKNSWPNRPKPVDLPGDSRPKICRDRFCLAAPLL